jgi:prolyl oligopeptidase
MNIPQTRREEIIDEIHGVKVSDPYRWLENAEDSEVQKWIENQNKYIDSILKNEIFNTFSSELVKNFKVVNFSDPFPVKGSYFYTERQPDEDQSVLYIKKGLNGNPTILFNPNGKRNGNTVTIDYWSPSKTGKYVAYGISEGGDEMATMYIKDTDTNKELVEKITNCRHSSVRWLPDDSGFFYTRNPRPGSVPKNEEHMHVKVYFHKLGDNIDNDPLIFGENRPKDDMLGITLSPDGKYLSIYVSQKWTENEIYIYDTQTKKTTLLVTGIKSQFSIYFLKDKVLLYTNYKANNYRILWTSYKNLYKPIDEWKEFVSEGEFLLQSFWATKSKILLGYLANACSEVVVLDYDAKEIDKIPLPKYSSLAGMSTNREEEEFFYSVTSFVFPKITYQYNPNTSRYSEYRRTDNPINPEDYEVKQEWFVSKDGTKVPMFIFYKKGIEMDGNNPTVLYGYGGFGNNQTPSFSRGWVPWSERGGIFAIANIRGGGEFGDKWHKDGIKNKKQNSFDDFIAAAEYLISKKYTNAEHLGILGGSNGGLLVSAVAIQRPELFKAVCSQVPLTDMVRFPKFGMAVRWVHEYGNPDIKEDLEKILLWSPYHNVKEQIKYPSFFFTTAIKDTRVDPLHSRKMSAILQNSNKKNKVLIFTEMDAGHGSGKPIIKIVETQALILSFFTQELGLEI